MRRSLYVLVLLVLLVPLASSVLSQVGGTTVRMSLPNLPAPVPPGGYSRFNVTVTYTWQAGVAAGPTTVTIETLSQPPWLNSTFTPSELTFDPSEGGRLTGGGSAKFTDLNLTVSPNAPAFELGLATYRVTAQPNGAFQGSEDTVELELMAGFSGDIDARLPDGEDVTAWGGFITHVPVRIENRGNGPLIVEVEVARFPAESIVTAPETIRVGTNPEDRVTVLDLEVQTPWKVSESGRVEVVLTPTHASRGTRDAPVEVAFELDGKSAIPVPAGSEVAPLALVVAALLAVGVRRRTARPR